MRALIARIFAPLPPVASDVSASDVAEARRRQEALDRRLRVLQRRK